MKFKLTIFIFVLLLAVSNVQTARTETANSQFPVGGLISGKLLKSNGKPRLHTEIELIPVGAEEKGSDLRLWAISDGRGNFVFKNLPAGNYHLSINFNETPSDTSPYSTFYFPNTPNRDEAKIFEIIDGSVFNRLSFKLPPELPSKFITGKVVWEDDEPVKDAFISLVDMEMRSSVSFGRFKTNDKGLFSIKTFVGRQYGIVAVLFDTPTLDFYSEVTARGQSEIFILDETTQPLKIIIKNLTESDSKDLRDNRIIGSIAFEDF